MTMIPAFLQISDSSGSAGLGALAAMGTGMMLFLLAIAVIGIIGVWKVFTKAGQPGWAAIIPIYNIIVLLQIVGRPIWWFILLLIPLVNLIILIILAIDLAKSFGKSAAWGFFLLFVFSFIGYLILGFGDARYVGPAAAGGSAVTA